MRLGEHLRQRYTAILKYTGLIWTIIGLLLLAPLLALPFYWDERVLAWGFLLPAVFLLILGLALWRGLKPEEGLNLTVIEGTVIVVLSWLAATTVGSIPFLLVGNLSFTQAYFESTSGWTTTGLSVVDVTTASRLILLHRSLMQLAGGAGFAIIVRATLTGPTGIGLTSAEGREQQLAPHVRQSAYIVLSIYIGYVLFGLIALRVAGMSWFDAVNHSFAALSTGGFSTRQESIGYWNSPTVEVVVIVLMLLGTTNFLTSYALLQGQLRRGIRSTQLKFLGLLLLLFVPITLLFVTLGLYPEASRAVRVAVFEVVSAASTTGFSTVGYTNWPPFGVLVLLILMLIGGGAGSTAGGIKQYRVVVLLRTLFWEVRRWFLPQRAVTAPTIWQGGQRRFLDDGQIRKDASFITLYLLVFLLGSAIIAAHGYSLDESLFEFASTVGTVGLSVGVTAADAPLSLLWIQIAGMILGRLEFFALIVGIVKLAKDVPDILRLPEAEAEIVYRKGTIIPGRHSVLVPVAAEGDAQALGRIGCLLAKGSGGQVLALTVIEVPSILNPLAGRSMLRERRPLVESVVEVGQQLGVPVQALVRSTRNIPNGITRTIRESNSDLALFGWPRPTEKNTHAFSPIIDAIVANPPCDIAVLRYRPIWDFRTLMVPVSGGANERLAVQTAVQLARSTAAGSVIRLIYVAAPGLAESEERADEVFARLTAGIPIAYEKYVVEADSAADGILRVAQNADIVIMGATKEPLLRNLLLGNVAQTVADKAPCSVLIVKRRSDLFRSMLRETVLKPVPQSRKRHVA